MKSILMMVALATTAPAMALTLGGGDQEVPTTYLSWCDGNAVIGQNDQGDLVVRANCSEQGKVCKSSLTYQEYGYVQSATCVDKK